MNFKNYDRVACVYDYTRKIPNQSVQFFKEKIYSYLQSRYNLTTYRILSIGAGTGRIESSLASSNHSLFGIDISQKMLSEFQKKELPTCYLVQADGLSLPFSKNFHLISAINFVHLIQDYRQFYNEVTNSTGSLLVGYAYTDTEYHPYYLKFRQLILENQREEQESDDTDLRDFHQFMESTGYKPEVCELKTDEEIRNIDIVSSLQNRYFRSLWEIDNKIFEKTLHDFKEYLSTSKDVKGETYSTYSITKLFFYELD